MWRSRVIEALALAAAATVVTIALGGSVLRAPSEQLFGMPIVGRHYDPFAVMTQMMAPLTADLYLQPVTDLPAALASRVVGPVAAHNWIVLASFPLAAVMAFLLARYIGLSRTAGAVAAMAFAFSPFHISQAAYHVHVAQTQWLPMYLLALWYCLDSATPGAVAFLVAATAAVTLSNYYGGLIAAVITPFAVGGHWWTHRVAQTPRALPITLATLGAAATWACIYVVFAASRIAQQPADLAYQRADLFRYGARWWSYLVPPVEHPLFGPTARRIWEAAGVRDGLLEQQITIGAGIAALAIVGAAGWWRRDPSRSAAHLPMLAAVGVVAFAFSLSPERGDGLAIRPAAWLYEVAPMFRSYARFGLVVQLAAVLVAGIGIDRLLRAGTRRSRIACLALVVLVVGEYVVRPSAMSRDVLPTAAHRWVATHAADARVLDCAAQTVESESVEWLTRGRVTLAGAAIESCAEAQLPELLAANGFTHVIERQPFDELRSKAGLKIQAQFDDGRLYAVTAEPPAIYTATTVGFHRRERDEEWTWRWIGGDGTWIIVNTMGAPLSVLLHLELAAFGRARDLEVFLDGQRVHAMRVQPAKQLYAIGPLQVLPGSRELVFHPVDAPTIASEAVTTADQRRLSFAVGASRWDVEGPR